MSIVAIIGRPNVGKSTLFNRLTVSKQAITDDADSITRDRQYGLCEWNGLSFTIIDTGGYIIVGRDMFQKEIAEQVDIALNESHSILFVVDVEVGIQKEDVDIARQLHKYNKPVFLIINKVDNSKRLLEIPEFYKLGYKDLYPISSINGSGTGELLTDLVKGLPDYPLKDVGDIPKVTIIGKPNVGKSSLINALLNEKRSIVTDKPGTTRDSIDSYYNYFNKEILLVDTAGIRKKSKKKENVEFYSIIRALKAIEKADVCILLIDATESIHVQEIAMLSHVERRKKGILLAVNKWDLIKDKETNSINQFTKKIRDKLKFFPHIPIVFISVIKKQRIYEVLEMAMNIYKNKHKHIKSAELNQVFLPIIEKKPPPMVKGKEIKIKYITQASAPFPKFIFFCNHPKLIQSSYKKYLSNQIQKKFDFNGISVNLNFKKK